MSGGGCHGLPQRSSQNGRARFEDKGGHACGAKVGLCEATWGLDQHTVAHGARGCEKHAASLRCSPRGASYHSSGDFSASLSVVGHGVLIKWAYGLSHDKQAPLTEICFVCSASATVRAKPRVEPPSRRVA